MVADTHDRPSDLRSASAFTEGVLRRVEAAERGRRRREVFRYLAPLLTTVVIGAAWTIALVVGASVVRLLIEALAWLSAVATIEEELSEALLGPFAPLPSIVSLLLFLAAIVWVRNHQPGPREWGP